ncbi:MAG: HAMP domain-containing histidine kinase [Deferribacterales bacterium]
MKLNEIKTNLQIKITLLIFILLISISVMVAVYLQLSAESRSKQIATTYAYGISKIIDSSLEYYMKKGHSEGVSELVQSMLNNPNIIGIHIFDNSGRSSCLNRKSPNANFSEEYLDIVISELEYRPVVKIIKVKDKKFLAYFSPYENKKECRSCHDEKDIIGVLNVNVDLSEIYSDIKIQIKKTFQVLLISSILISIILSYLIHLLIIKPIRMIENGMKDVMDNKLDVKVDIKSGDELENLANNFNNMVKSLDQANKTIDTMHKGVIHTDRLMTIGKLTASISHEIKNPLNSIMITSDILLEYCNNMNGDPKLKKYIESIIEDANRIKNIIDLTLNFSRYESSSNEIINLKDLIKNVTIYANRILFYKTNTKFKLQDNTHEGLCLQGNRTHLEQMIVNILKNAVESIPEDKEGSVTFKIYDNDNTVFFEIMDNGIGISKNKLELIFQEFYSTKTNGTGLGLSIVKEIVENHNGALCINSEENKGTTVIIQLPMYKGEKCQE